MLLSNLQDNIVKAPIVMTSHAAAAEKSKVEASAHRVELREQVQKTEKAVNDVSKTKQEGGRRESDNPEKLSNKNRRQQAKKHATERHNTTVSLANNRPVSPAPRQPDNGHAHIDITI